MPTLLSILSSKITYCVLLVLICFSYYTYSHLTIKNLRQNIIELEESLTVLQNKQEKLIENIKKVTESYKEIEKQKISAQKKISELQETLYRENFNKKSLKEIAIAKPSLTEKLINDATKKNIDCFSNLSEGTNEDC